MGFLLRKGAHSPKEHYIRLDSHLYFFFMIRVMLIFGTKEINFHAIAKLSFVLTKAGIFGIVVVD